MPGLATLTAGPMTGKNATTKRNEEGCITTDVPITKCGNSNTLYGKVVAVIATDRHNVSNHLALASRVPVTAGTIIGVAEMNEQELLVNSTKDVLMAIHGEDGVTVLGCQFVPQYQDSRVLITAGAITGGTEMNWQELRVNTTEDVLINIAWVVDVIAMDRQFAKPNQEVGIKIISLKN